MRLNQVYLMVSDYEDVVEFYSEALGLPLLRDDDGHAEFDTGACSLVIEREFDEETLSSFGLEPPSEPRGSGAIVVVEVDDVEEVYHRLTSRGISPKIEPREVSWGRKLFLVEDPAGYVLEISQPL